jgi:hypothetical protein
MPPVGFAVVGLGTLATTAILPAFRGMQRAKQIEALSLAIRGGPLPPSCGVDGYIDMAIIEALYRSATTGIPQDVEVIPSS